MNIAIGCNINNIIKNAILRINVIPSIGAANKFEIKNVNDIVLKWYIIIGIIIMLAESVTTHICFT